jgi:hypothetical protein
LPPVANRSGLPPVALLLDRAAKVLSADRVHRRRRFDGGATVPPWAPRQARGGCPLDCAATLAEAYGAWARA